jgi:hypothetical protein
MWIRHRRWLVSLVGCLSLSLVGVPVVVGVLVVGFPVVVEGMVVGVGVVMQGVRWES